MEEHMRRKEKMTERRAKLEQRDWMIKQNKNSPRKSHGRKKSKEKEADQHLKKAVKQQKH